MINLKFHNTLALAFVCAFVACSPQSPLENPVVSESESPTKVGTALFLTVGFQDRGDEFYVRDPAVANGNPILVSRIFREVGRFGVAVWSKDGSVIAVQHAGDTGFLHAYDFQEHQRVGAFWSGTIPPLQAVNEQREPIGKTIQALLDRRGGTNGVTVSRWCSIAGK